MLDESAEAIHQALRDAVSAQDLDGLTRLVKAYEKSPPTGNARILLDQALNTKVQNGGTILENATVLSLGNPSRFDKLRALNIVHMVKALGAGNVAFETSAPKTSITERKLFSAIKNGDAEHLEALLKNGSIDLDQFHPVMQSPLIFATKRGNSAVVELLIKHGADVNLQNPDGNTALHFAAMNNSSKIISVLRNNHADDEITNRCKETPLNCAARNGNAAAMQELIDWGAITDKGPDTRYMLLSALKNGDTDVAEVLVNALIKKARSDDTKSAISALNDALHSVAEHGGSRRLMRHLEQGGADIDYVNANGKTPLMMAAKFGHINAVQWLVRHGAQQETTDFGDHTALALAKRYKQTEIVNFLENPQPAE